MKTTDWASFDYRKAELKPEPRMIQLWKYAEDRFASPTIVGSSLHTTRERLGDMMKYGDPIPDPVGDSDDNGGV